MQHILKKLNLEINFDKQPRSRSEYLLIIAKRLIKDSRIEDFLIIIELIEDECLKSELLSECMDKLDMMNNSDLYKIIDLIVDKYYKSNALIILINKVIKFDNKQFDLKLLFKKLINSIKLIEDDESKLYLLIDLIDLLEKNKLDKESLYIELIKFVKFISLDSIKSNLLVKILKTSKLKNLYKHLIKAISYIKSSYYKEITIFKILQKFSMESDYISKIDDLLKNINSVNPSFEYQKLFDILKIIDKQNESSTEKSLNLESIIDDNYLELDIIDISNEIDEDLLKIIQNIDLNNYVYLYKLLSLMVKISIDFYKIENLLFKILDKIQLHKDNYHKFYNLLKLFLVNLKKYDFVEINTLLDKIIECSNNINDESYKNSLLFDIGILIINFDFNKSLEILNYIKDSNLKNELYTKIIIYLTNFDLNKALELAENINDEPYKSEIFLEIISKTIYTDFNKAISYVDLIKDDIYKKIALLEIEYIK